MSQVDIPNPRPLSLPLPSICPRPETVPKLAIIPIREKSSSTPDLRTFDSPVWQNLTLKQIAVMRHLRESLRHSSDETIDDGVRIVDLWNCGEVPDEFYAVYVHSNDRSVISSDEIERRHDEETNSTM